MNGPGRPLGRRWWAANRRDGKSIDRAAGDAHAASQGCLPKPSLAEGISALGREVLNDQAARLKPLPGQIEFVFAMEEQP